MPGATRVIMLGLVLAGAAMPRLAAAQAADKPAAVAGHHAARQKARPATLPTPSAGGAIHMDDWFSLGPEKEAQIEKEAPGVQIKVHDPQEDDIIVYGQRQKRDFEGATPAPNLTSPQSQLAAQPAFVPAMGESCTYKYGCFDSGQTPLRSTIFGD